MLISTLLLFGLVVHKSIYITYSLSIFQGCYVFKHRNFCWFVMMDLCVFIYCIFLHFQTLNCICRAQTMGASWPTRPRHSPCLSLMTSWRRRWWWSFVTWGTNPTNRSPASWTSSRKPKGTRTAINVSVTILPWRMYIRVMWPVHQTDVLFRTHCTVQGLPWEREHKNAFFFWQENREPPDSNEKGWTNRPFTSMRDAMSNIKILSSPNTAYSF